MLTGVVARFPQSKQLAFVRALEESLHLDAIENPSFQ